MNNNSNLKSPLFLALTIFFIASSYTLQAMEQPNFQPVNPEQQQLRLTCNRCSKVFNNTDSIFVCDSTHQFHKHCLIEWFNCENFKCPVCNKELKKDESQQRINFSEILASFRIRKEAQSYLSHLPKELHQELEKFCTSFNPNPAYNFWLLKHKQEKGFLFKTLLTGHKENIVSLACDYKNNRLFSGSWDGTIMIWDLKNGILLNTLKININTKDNVEYFSFDLEHNQVAAINYYGRIIIFNLENGKLIHELKTGQGLSYISFNHHYLFNYHDNQLFCGSNDGTIKIWDLETGNCLQTLEGHSDKVTCLAFDPEHNRLFSGSRDNSIKIWDIKTGICVQTLKDTKPVLALILDHKNKCLVLVYNVEMKLLDLKDFTVIKTLNIRGASFLAFNQAHTWLFKKEQFSKFVEIWDLENGICIQSSRAEIKDDIHCFEFDQKHNRLLFSYGNTIKMWELHDDQMNQALHRIPLEYQNYLKVLFEKAYDCFRNKIVLDLSTDKDLLSTFLLLPEEMQQIMQKYLKIIMPAIEKEALPKNDDTSNNDRQKKETWGDWLLGKPC